jgi:hypothetical protein
MLPWLERPTITIDLQRPLSQRFDSISPEALALSRRLLDSILKEVPANLLSLAELARLRTMSRFHDEAVSVAQQVGVDWRAVMLANLSYDLILAHFGCSTVALPTPRGPVVARNMDWWPEDLLAQASFLIRYTEGDTFRFANAGWPGAIGLVTGLSARGFGVVLNAVTSPEGVNQTGYPVLLHLRRVIEDAQDFDDALRMLTEQKLAAPALITLVGSANEQRVVIERTPIRHALRWPEGDGPLVTTNDYRLLFQPQASEGAEIYRTTCARFDALNRFFAGHRPDREVKDEALLYILSDPAVIQGITAQHIILRPRQGEVRLFIPRRFGHPAEA